MRLFGGQPAEWTVELAPATVTEDRLAVLKALGVTRISLGVQSFNDGLLDALGRQRGRGNDSATADQDQTLNQLLIEMDGFDQSSSIVVIGSTNRPDVLDRALTRPGRNES